MTEVKIEIDHYQALGLTSTATEKQIRKAYKKLCQKYHPDKDPDNEAHFMRIRKAYDVLMDPQRRAIYDQGLRQGINPEEFKTVLQAMVEKVIQDTLVHISRRAGQGQHSNFLSVVNKALAEQHVALSGDKEKLEIQQKIILKQMKSIKEGRDTYMVRSLVQTGAKIRAAVRATEIALAVLKYLREDTKRIVCPQEENPAARMQYLLGQASTSSTNPWS